MNIDWYITDMERLASDGFVVAVYFKVTAIDGDHQATICRAVNYTQDQNETCIPYEQLTSEIVVGWVQEAVGKEVTEALISKQIGELKNPVVHSGLPW
jgi:hypothetical protein